MGDQTQPQGMSQATRNMVLLFHSPGENSLGGNSVEVAEWQAHWRRRGRSDITEYMCHLLLWYTQVLEMKVVSLGRSL